MRELQGCGEGGGALCGVPGHGDSFRGLFVHGRSVADGVGELLRAGGGGGGVRSGVGGLVDLRSLETRVLGIYGGEREKS